jgi:hypothetical protein
MKDSDVNNEINRMTDNRKEDLVYRLRKRAEIRRQIPTRKSVQDNQPDRLSDLLEEAANEIERLNNNIKPFAWFDPSNNHMSQDKNDPLFTPLGQLLPLYRQSNNINAGIDRNTDNKEYSIGTEEGYKEFKAKRNKI